MGQSTLIGVIAALFLGGFMLHNIQRTSLDSDEKLSEHQYHVIARDAASTGLDVTVRKLGYNLDPWSWSNNIGTYNVADLPYNGGFYTVEANLNQCTILSDAKRTEAILIIQNTIDPSFNPGQHLVEIRATGYYDTAALSTDDRQSHRFDACYAQTDYDTGTPPSFMYAFISDSTFTFNGNPDISALLGSEGYIHSNEEMHLGPQVELDGHATMVDYNGSTYKNNTQFSSFTEGVAQPMVMFDPTSYIDPTHAEYVVPDMLSEGGMDITGALTVGDASYTSSNPYLWVIDGDLTIQANAHLVLPGYTEIIVTGSITLAGGANVTVSGTVPPQNTTEEQMMTWIDAQLGTNDVTGETEGKIMFYSAAGYPDPYLYDPNDPPAGVTIAGNSTVVGSFYTNGDYIMNGGGQGSNMVGSIASMGEITANGGGNGSNIYYIGIADELIIPGVKIPARQILRIALSEWTDPVLDANP